MRTRRFLAVHDIPAGTTVDGLKEMLTRVSERAHALGIHTVETFYSLERGRAYDLFEAGTREQVAQAFKAANLPAPDVFPAERLHTEFLDEPRRMR